MGEVGVQTPSSCSSCSRLGSVVRSLSTAPVWGVLMLSLCRISVGLTVEDPTSLLDELASGVDAQGGRTELVWPAPDQRSIYVVVDQLEASNLVQEAIADSLGGDLLPIGTTGVPLENGVELELSGRALFGPTLHSLLMAVPPETAICPYVPCSADLTIEPHKDGCPWKTR